jgi:hypothetical protein
MDELWMDRFCSVEMDASDQEEVDEHNSTSQVDDGCVSVRPLTLFAYRTRRGNLWQVQ